MGSQKKLFSRRSIVGFCLGILLGFNFASWLAIPVPSRTDIEIEVIARDGGISRREDVEGLAGFRVGSARIRRNNKLERIKTGKDCDHEVPYEFKDYANNIDNSPKKKADYEERINEQVPRNIRNDAKIPPNQDPPLKDYQPNEKHTKRPSDFDVFYEDDSEAQEEGELSQQARNEDLQLPHNSQKLANYDSYGKAGPKEYAGAETEPKISAERNRRAQVADPAPQKQARLASDSNVRDGKHFMYIGVLTAQKYLATRGRAIMQTWAPGVPGKVEFYVGQGVTNVEDGGKPLPLMRLASVQDNVYPPQKKSFLMLKQMYDSYLNSGYQWFMRADDDVYIKTDKLERFLRRLNSSQPLFLGQMGLGNAEERGRLSLSDGENYCMGGPGMIFSREVLRRVGPHIRKCVKNLYSWHEDVELSRCVRQFADVNCAWSYEMQELFYEHYHLRQGYIDPTINPHNPKLISSMTLHPNKNPAYQAKLHVFVRSRKIQKLMTRIKFLQRDVVNFKRELGQRPSMEQHMLGLKPTLNRYIPQNGKETLSWDFFSERLLFATPPEQARRSIPSHRQGKIRHIIVQVMRMMNSNSRVRGRLIDFKQVAYGYRRVNPLYGPEYVLDLLLLYKRYKGKKTTIPVRRHAYIQQTFARAQLGEEHSLDVDDIRRCLANSRQNIVGSVMSSLLKRSRTMVSLFGRLEPNAKVPSRENVPAELPDGSLSYPGESPRSPSQKLRYDSGRFSSSADDLSAANARTVHIIVPLVGRLETFRKFMANLAHVSLSRDDPISLLLILFKQSDPAKRQEGKETVELLESYAERYPLYDLRHIEINGEFSRGLALEIGASHFTNESLLFFCDVDVVFDARFTRNCRASSVLGSRVYYPILFSEFHPKSGGLLSVVGDTGMSLALHDERAIREAQRDMNHFNVTEHGGYWRNYGYGLLCVYQSDFMASGGFDLKIQGWGLEDVNLIDKFVGSRSAMTQRNSNLDEDLKQTRWKTLDVVRTPDPALVHVYHPSHCNPNLAENQLRMCLASRASGITSVGNLASAWFRSGRAAKKTDSSVKDPVSGIIPIGRASPDHKEKERVAEKQPVTFERLPDVGYQEDVGKVGERTLQLKRRKRKKASGVR